MQWNWVVEPGVNSPFRQVLLYFIAVFDLHDVEMVDMLSIGHLDRQNDIGIAQLLVVQSRDLAALVVPLIQMGQLDRKQSSLQPLEPKIKSGQAVLIFAQRAMVAQHTQFLRQISIVGDNRSALAESAEILSRIEAKAACKTNRPRLSPLIFGTVS